MDFWRSDDILIISYMLVADSNVQLLDVIQDYPRHFLFQLSNPARCDELKRAYLSGAQAPALQLFSMREQLINEIKSRERNE